MSKVLIICGPTATGKTKLAIKIASIISAELVSADSRQVYIGMDVVTGKDLPEGQTSHLSDIYWHDRYLKTYNIDQSQVWLYDIVHPNEPFNVSFWKECAELVISSIHSRKKLPIVVGGTGLYIKSITDNLSDISIPINYPLREHLSSLSTRDLFLYLSKVDPIKAANLNLSDRSNPRRLTRAIEISLSPSTPDTYSPHRDILSIGLTSSREKLLSNVQTRVDTRLMHGAKKEAELLAQKYPLTLPSMAACGYSALMSDAPVVNWITTENQLVKRQLTWFKKQKNINWFDISDPEYESSVINLVTSWYNK
jgi:tRNA dimethylallyltransferase